MITCVKLRTGIGPNDFKAGINFLAASAKLALLAYWFCIYPQKGGSVLVLHPGQLRLEALVRAGRGS